MKTSIKAITGVILVVIGTLLLLDRMGIFFPYSIDIWRLIGMFWPLILIAIGIKLLMDKNTTGGIILFSLGCILLLSNVFTVNFFSLLWPLIIIGIGLSILFRDRIWWLNRTSSDKSSEDYITDSVAFWGSERKLSSKNFKGGELNVVFGGMELDLREVKIDKKGANLNVNVAFGGVEIHVPTSCRVITSGTGVLGGWEPNLKENDIKEPILEITGTAILGAVEINN